MNVNKAIEYLEAVKDHKRCIPIRRFRRQIGRTGQAKEFGTDKGRWPIKSCEHILDLLKNAIGNAEAKGLDVDSLVIQHIQANMAPKLRRRVFRAHGRINPFLSNPSHIEVIVGEPTKDVPSARELIPRGEFHRRTALLRLEQGRA